jgi:hypothetical protein
MSNDVQELLMVKMSLSAIRTRVNEELDALECQIARLLPDDVPTRKVPTGRKARQKYYKERLSKL